MCATLGVGQLMPNLFQPPDCAQLYSTAQPLLCLNYDVHVEASVSHLIYVGCEQPGVTEGS